MATSSKGVSALALSRQLGLGYKTAWFLTQRIRDLTPRDWKALRRMVEVSEPCPGGKRTTRRAGNRDPDDHQPKSRTGSRKTMAVVAMERGKRGKARATR
jgi:hypothetical protein